MGTRYGQYPLYPHSRRLAGGGIQVLYAQWKFATERFHQTWYSTWHGRYSLEIAHGNNYKNANAVTIYCFYLDQLLGCFEGSGIMSVATAADINGPTWFT
jgi:hypothetical protein